MGLKGYGIPVETMSSSELGTHNRARTAAGILPVACGFKCTVVCQNLPASRTVFTCGFTEGLENPIVAFIAELGKKAAQQWGEGRLDAIRGEFVWQPLKMADRTGQKQ